MSDTGMRNLAARHPLVGPLLWIFGVQYFVMQIVVGLAWAEPYSVLHNTISDLGNTTCGPYRATLVCSPLHDWMNLSFVLLGVTMALGALFIYSSIHRSIGNALGFSCMALAGIGIAIVGFFPENTTSSLHILGAALTFLVGNLALLVLGCTLAMPRAFRILTLIAGVTALLALGLFISDTYLGMGIGGVERIAAYPQIIWIILFGIYQMSVRSRVPSTHPYAQRSHAAPKP